MMSTHAAVLTSPAELAAVHWVHYSKRSVERRKRRYYEEQADDADREREAQEEAKRQVHRVKEEEEDEQANKVRGRGEQSRRCRGEMTVCCV